MSEPLAPVDLILLWHHHQPDYRSPRDGRAALPWVRLHASKDYLDMARHLERHPGVRATFNFVPSLIDQIEGVVAGEADELFDRLARPVAGLTPDERRQVAWRCGQAPAHAIERWPAYRALRERLAPGVIAPLAGSIGASIPALGGADELAAGDSGAAAERDLLALEIWFLLAWIDPMFHDAPEVVRALADRERWTERHRDALLQIHRRLAAEVIPAYRALAARGQIELSASPYYHPILPLISDLSTARRARVDLALPAERLVAPEDARWHIERGLERHATAFGARPAGMWPSEGSVSPETVALAAAAGVRWLASDEGVLWASLPEVERRRGALYRAWDLMVDEGAVALFFRDHELSDRIGFVYQRWEASEAAADMVARLRRIGREHAGAAPPLVSIILDGENCWEHYPEDGGPFLAALYGALERAPDIRTRTPSEVLTDAVPRPRLERLHSGSWIDADFHIWIGHPEKNRAWDLLARARRALIESGAGPERAPQAWLALYRAEGSDWFWWFGDDHPTPDRWTFDRLFRELLQAVYEHAGLTTPAALGLPIVREAAARGAQQMPIGFVKPVLDGRRTTFYEWHAAGRFELGAGGAMHRGGGLVRELLFGFDAGQFYLRLDFTGDAPPGPEFDLTVELVEPRPARLRVQGLGAGQPVVAWAAGPDQGKPVDGAECRVGQVLELGLPFASLGLAPGEAVTLLVHATRDDRPLASFPDDAGLVFHVPTAGYESTMWSA
jgi:alpha-amylase/alpha-mannosidase (GH57 family)